MQGTILYTLTNNISLWQADGDEVENPFVMRTIFQNEMHLQQRHSVEEFKYNFSNIMKRSEEVLFNNNQVKIERNILRMCFKDSSKMK